MASKAFIGKAVTGFTGFIGIALMIANNLFRAFDHIPYGTLIVFVGFFVIWGVIYSAMSRYGYFDWFNGK